jgi:undecaprenyl-diphosphatase
VLRSRLSPALPAAAIAAIAALVLILPFPGSLSVVATRSLSGTFSAIPGVALLSEILLVLLAVATAGALVHVVMRHPERRGIALAAAFGVGVAYAASEGVKLLVAQPRPCSSGDLRIECPPPGDWSFPSNHATLAFGAVVVIIVAIQRVSVAWLAVGAAALVAGGRVAQGVHYLHDVAAGALLGLAIPVALVAAIHGWKERTRRRR